MGIRGKEEKMKQQFANLSKREREKIEATYHKKKSEDFNGLMADATPHTPDVIRLPSRLTAQLKLIAAREGEPEYQSMVTRWVKERAQKETKLAQSAKRSLRKKTAVLKRAIEK